MRREISRSWLSLTAAGAVRSALSIVMTTSAWLRAGRLPEPAKITASMSAARSDLCEDSPITQRSASTRLDLPQPFGPTTPVRPGSIRKSVGSTNDLNPSRRSLVSFMPRTLPYALARVSLSLKWLIGPCFRRPDSFCPHLPQNESRRGCEQQQVSRFAEQFPLVGGHTGVGRMQELLSYAEKPLSCLDIGIDNFADF